MFDFSVNGGVSLDPESSGERAGRTFGASDLPRRPSDSLHRARGVAGPLLPEGLHKVGGIMDSIATIRAGLQMSKVVLYRQQAIYTRTFEDQLRWALIYG